VILPRSERAAGEKDVTVRMAEQADAGGVLGCLRAAFEEYRDQYTPEAFADTVPDLDSLNQRLRTMCVYVAVSQRGEVMGTLAAAAMDNGEGHLRGMAVHPSFQHRGVAKELLTVAIDDLRRSRCTRVTLDTTEPLRPAIRFYEAHGFRPTGRVSDFFGMELHEYARTLK
jgi:putative acetyltransferase